MRRALVLLLVATSAHANVWIDAAKGDSSTEVYQRELNAGDELARDANSAMLNPRDASRFIANAIKAYRAAAKAKPDAGEPYYRIGRLLYSFYFECEAFDLQLAHPPLADCHEAGGFELFDPIHAQQIIDAWDAFEARAPLDPRLDGQADANPDNLRFRRALLHTKFGTLDHLSLAAHDYEIILALKDPASTDGVVRNNLAETYMMLDRLDDAIAMYGLALLDSSSPSTSMGLAVALDRSGREDQARDEIMSVGTAGQDRFRDEMSHHDVFFVPEGENFYYEALLAEVTHDDPGALAAWRAYIHSGAHPEYQPRAKQHIDALLAPPKAPPRDAPYREVEP